MERDNKVGIFSLRAAPNELYNFNLITAFFAPRNCEFKSWKIQFTSGKIRLQKGQMRLAKKKLEQNEQRRPGRWSRKEIFFLSLLGEKSFCIFYESGSI